MLWRLPCRDIFVGISNIFDQYTCLSIYEWPYTADKITTVTVIAQPKHWLHSSPWWHIKYNDHDDQRQIHMFLDILEFRVENKKKYLVKTVLVTWCQTCGSMAKMVRKITSKKSL